MKWEMGNQVKSDFATIELTPATIVNCDLGSLQEVKWKLESRVEKKVVNYEVKVSSCFSISINQQLVY